MKTELVEAAAGCGGGADVVTGAERSKRSPIADDCAGLGAGAAAGAGAGEEKPPKLEKFDD